MTAPYNRQIDKNGAMIDPGILNPSQGSYIMELTPKEGANQVYVSIPAATLAGLRLQNPDFYIDIEAPFGIYRLPVNIEDRLEDLDEIVLRTSSFRVTLTDKTADKAITDALQKSLPQAKAISSFVDFKLELIDTLSKEILMQISDFAGIIEHQLPVLAAQVTKYYGAFRFNEATQSFNFVPHNAAPVDTSGRQYITFLHSGNGIYVAVDNHVPFSDVPENAWYASLVSKAAAKSLVKGVGNNSYEPNRAVTRAEFVQMIVNAMLLPETGSNPYKDVAADQWFYSAITRSYALGLLDQFTQDSFYPNRPITREEMATILAAVLRKCGVSSTAALGQFTDAVSMENAYMPDIALVFSTGLMQGVSDDKFDPKGVTTRAQAATVQIRLLETLNMIDK
jgi:hypothetical protein